MIFLTPLTTRTEGVLGENWCYNVVYTKTNTGDAYEVDNFRKYLPNGDVSVIKTLPSNTRRLVVRSIAPVRKIAGVVKVLIRVVRTICPKPLNSQPLWWIDYINVTRERTHTKISVDLVHEELYLALQLIYLETTTLVEAEPTEPTEPSVGST